jgi:hypothetical protein
MNINELTKIRVLNAVTGKNFNLLGFRTTGGDREGIYVSSMTLHDVDNRQVIVVDDIRELKKYQLINT